MERGELAMHNIRLAVLGLLFLTTAAGANPTDVTAYTGVEPVAVDGKAKACSAAFVVVHQDPQYHQGRKVNVLGSLNYAAFADSPPFFVLKLAIQQSDSETDLASPSEAVLFRGSDSNRADGMTSMAGEKAGFRLFPFRATTLTTTMAVPPDGKLRFGYAMNPGAAPSIVDVDFGISPGTAASWRACILDATNAALKQLKQ